jgi:hypothetical protein
MQNYLEHRIIIIDRIMDWEMAFRIPFFSCINIVLPLSYRNSRYSTSSAQTGYIVLQ